MLQADPAGQANWKNERPVCKPNFVSEGRSCKLLRPKLQAQTRISSGHSGKSAEKNILSKKNPTKEAMECPLLEVDLSHLSERTDIDTLWAFLDRPPHGIPPCSDTIPTANQIWPSESCHVIRISGYEAEQPLNFAFSSKVSEAAC